MARAHGDDERAFEEASAALAGFGDDLAGLVVACRRILARHPAHGRLWALCARVLVAADPVAEARKALVDARADPTARRLADAFPADASVAAFAVGSVLADALEGRADVRVYLLDDGSDGRGGALPVRGRGRADLAAFDDMFGGRIGHVENWGPRRRSRGETHDPASDLDDDARVVEVPLSRMGRPLCGAAAVLLGVVAASDTGALVPVGALPVAATARHLGRPVWLVAPAGVWLPSRLFERLVADATRLSEVEVVPLALVDRVAGPGGLVDVGAAVRRADCPVAPELLR